MVSFHRFIRRERLLFQSLCRFAQRDFSGICVNDEISEALHKREAVVALESTIITHGMKFPENFITATAVQNIIREQGAIPATIAVLKGQIKVGLTDQELEELSYNQENCFKISRRDYPYIISKRLTGGTTVSGTMLIAQKVGIPIFVTGGVGGVHREGETTLDVSADLTELGRTPVAVISSGVKSILDIEKTLEYLETQGVAVATYGPTKGFPAFYCSKSNFESPYNLTSEVEAAEFIQTIFDLELNSGILIGVPVPEKYSCNEADIEGAINEGLRKAKEKDIKGKAVTPFLLSEISKMTGGKSLETNIALVKNNAGVGGRIAVEHAKLRRKGGKLFHWDPPLPKQNSTTRNSNNGKVVVVGAANIDFIVNITDDGFKMDGRTIGGRISQGGGGVGRNIADALGKLRVDTFLITAVGEEEFGEFVTRKTIPHLDSGGIIKVPKLGTGTCVVLCDHTGECLLVVGDMDIHANITIDHVKRHEKRLLESSLVVLDGNLREDTLEFVLRLCHQNGVPVWYEPTDFLKASKPFKKSDIPRPNFISPNYQEFLQIYQTFFPEKTINENTTNDPIEDCITKGIELIDFIDNIIVTLGKNGVLIIRKGDGNDPFFEESKYLRSKGRLSHRLYKTEILPETEVVNVSGAGDCFASGFISSMLMGHAEETCVQNGFKCSKASLKCDAPVPNTFFSMGPQVFKALPPPTARKPLPVT